MKAVLSKILVASSLFLAASLANAVPVLQLGIGGGSYDLTTETIVTDASSFTLYAYARATGNKAIDVNETHYLSIALTPQTGPDPVPFGSFDFEGSTYDIDNMVYGNPPLEDELDRDAHDLQSHSIYDTFFLEYAFQFSAAQTTALVNTQDNPSHVPDTVGDDLYFVAFDVDVSGLDAGFGLHFDLYNTKIRNNHDIDVDNFAPFSHDAGTANDVQEVPEPTPLALLGLGLVGLGLMRRQRATA